MTALFVRAAIDCVRAWTWLYTWRMPPASRQRRRAEIAADVWESRHDGAFHILCRLFIGVPDDLGWRLEQAAAAGTLTHRTIVVSARVAGAALFICALWVIDLDASRKRPPVLQLWAQSPTSPVRGPAFEAASVKPNKSGDARSTLVPQPGGRLMATNVTAAALIQFAYGLPDFQIAGGPNWLSADRFDVVATGEGDPPLEQERLMLRRLLTDRFRLSVHTETRELPIYTLVMARSDRKMGRQLRRTETDCARATSQTALGVGLASSDGPPPCGYFGMAPGTDFRAGRGGFAFRGLTMVALAKMLVPMVRRSVSDQTGLSGYFDADFDFLAEIGPPPPPPGLPDPFDRASFLSVFTVLPEQLGLKLESRRGPVDVLVIDRAEKPAPD